MEPYRSYFPHAGLLLPVTEALSERIFSLPTGTAVDEGDISRVIALVGDITSRARAAAHRPARVA